MYNDDPIPVSCYRYANNLNLADWKQLNPTQVW